MKTAKLRHGVIMKDYSVGSDIHVEFSTESNVMGVRVVSTYDPTSGQSPIKISWYGGRSTLKDAVAFNLVMDEAVHYAMELEQGL